MNKLKVGDVVKLPSSSPEMTIVGIWSDKTADVLWFVGDWSTYYKDNIPLAALKLVNENKESEVKNMNKTDLIREIALDTSLSLREVSETLKSFFDIVSDELSDGKRICIVGFGTFKVVEWKARNTTNPRTHKKMRIPKKYKASFKPSQYLRDRINYKKELYFTKSKKKKKR